MSLDERDRVVALEGRVTHLRSDLSRAEDEIRQLKGMEARLMAAINAGKSEAEPPLSLHDIGRAVQGSVEAAIKNLNLGQPYNAPTDGGGNWKSEIQSALQGKRGGGPLVLAATIFVLALSILSWNPNVRHLLPFL